MNNAEDEKEYMSKATGEVVDISEEDDKAGAIAEAGEGFLSKDTTDGASTGEAGCTVTIVLLIAAATVALVCSLKKLQIFARTIGEAVYELAFDNHCKEDVGGSSTTTGSLRSEDRDHSVTEESAVNDKDNRESAHEGRVPAAASVINLGDYKSLSNTPLECYKLGKFVKNMIADRADIERDYASKLYHWAALWRNPPMKQYPQGNSLRRTLDAFLDEAIEVHILQTKLSRCMTNAGKQITDWMKANLTWTVLGGCREKKNLERDFRRTQGFWQKLLGYVEKAKAAYHASLKKAQQNSKESDHTTAKDSKISIEIANNEDIYKNLIRDAEEAKEEYIQQMGSVYNKCGRMEKNKELAIDRALKMIQKKLHDQQEIKMISVYKEFTEAVKVIDVESDLENWEEEKGVNDELQIPTFEAECSEDCSCQHSK